jgi:hypothetical protein
MNQQDHSSSVEPSDCISDVFSCECSNPCHMLWVTGDNLDVSITVRLVHYRSFLKRILPAIKYLFGLDAGKCCDYDSIILGEERTKKLSDFLVRLADRIDVEKVLQESKDNPVKENWKQRFREWLYDTLCASTY